MLCDSRRKSILFQRETYFEDPHDSTSNQCSFRPAHKRLLQNVLSGPTKSDVEEDKRGFAANKAGQKICAPMVK